MADPIYVYIFCFSNKSVVLMSIRSVFLEHLLKCFSQLPIKEARMFANYKEINLKRAFTKAAKSSNEALNYCKIEVSLKIQAFTDPWHHQGPEKYFA